MRPRRGYLLAEALCALALGGLLAVAAATVLSGTRAAIRRIDERVGAERVAREALGVAAALIRASDTVVVLGDTAVDLRLHIGSGVACGADSLEIWLAPSRVALGEALTSWAQLPDAGDEVAWFSHDPVSGTHRWAGETIDATAERAPTSPCDGAHGWIASGDAAARMHVLALRAPVSAPAPGAPARITRRGRLALYVDGRGEWMLGWRRCLPSVCGVVQPVAGPLRAPAAGGFQVSAPDAHGLIEISVHAAGAPTPVVSLVPGADAVR